MALYHWGCDSEIQWVLTDNTSFDRVRQLGFSYKDFGVHMLKCEVFGLEQFS
jgi:hypothetical protein